MGKRCMRQNRPLHFAHVSPSSIGGLRTWTENKKVHVRGENVRRPSKLKDRKKYSRWKSHRIANVQFIFICCRWFAFVGWENESESAEDKVWLPCCMFFSWLSMFFLAGGQSHGIIPDKSVLPCPSTYKRYFIARRVAWSMFVNEKWSVV